MSIKKVSTPISRVKTSNTINIIMSLRLGVGLYSNIGNTSMFTTTAKLYCICFAALTTYMHIILFSNYVLRNETFIGQIHKIVVYSSIAFVSIVSNGENFYSYLQGLYSIDTSFIPLKKYETLVTICIFILVILQNMLRLLFIIAKHVKVVSLSPVLMIFILCLMSLGINLNHMTRIMMFELLWNRMRSLRYSIEKKLDFSHTPNSNHTKLQIRMMEEHLYVYNELLDNLKYAGHASKLLIFLSLPSYFIYVFSFVFEIARNSYEVDVIYITDATFNIILPCVPTILAELISVEVDKIKVHLTRQLLLCTDESLRNRTYDALKYLELRPFTYTIWRAFYVNISLPLGLISLCTTYIIVLIQFTHLIG